MLSLEVRFISSLWSKPIEFLFLIVTVRLRLFVVTKRKDSLVIF